MVEWNKNISNIYEISGRKVVSKFHEKPIFFRRELFFYDLFEKIPLIKIPDMYSAEDLNLQTYFIESGEKDVFQAAKDWGKVHSYFMKNPVRDNRFLIGHDAEEVASYVSNTVDTLGGIGPAVEERVSEIKMNKNLKTILHGDLQGKNMITSPNGNYYFDFELGGVGHPGRDVASMIISKPWEREKLLSIYRDNFDFDYFGFGEDVDSWVLLRASQLYSIFSGREGSVQQRKEILGKLFGIVESFV